MFLLEIFSIIDFCYCCILCGWIIVRDIRCKKWCIQLCGGDGGAFDWQKAIRQVKVSYIAIKTSLRSWKFLNYSWYCFIHSFPLCLYSSIVQFKVRTKQSYPLCDILSKSIETIFGFNTVRNFKIFAKTSWSNKSKFHEGNCCEKEIEALCSL